MTIPPNWRVEADRAAWLGARGIGGSDVAAVRGRSPFSSAWDVWANLQPDVQQVDRSSEATAEGQRFEEFVLAEYRHATGRDATRLEHVVVTHPEFCWATGSPDGFVGALEGGLELKTYRQAGGWGESGTVIEAYSIEADEVVPPYYLDQAYWYLEVTGLPWWDIAVWLPRRWGFPELRWFRVMADRRHQRSMLLEVARWRQRHLVDGVMPDADASAGCRRYLSSRPADPAKAVRDATDDEAALVQRLAWARETKRQAEAAERQAEAELGMLLGSTYGVRVAEGRCLWVQSRGRPAVDLDRLRREFPAAAEACVSQGQPFRKFQLYLSKES